MIKSDYDAWVLAKSQMGDSFTQNKYSKLTIDSRDTPINGLKSMDRQIHDMNEEAKIAEVQLSLIE